MHPCRVQLLEISQYLEHYLWPHFAAGLEGPASYEHLMSMLVMVNQKFREGVPGWACFHAANEVRAAGAPRLAGEGRRCCAEAGCGGSPLLRVPPQKRRR